MGKLTGKVVVITGGGSGVGKAAAKLCLAEGAKVVIAGRDSAKLVDVCEEFAAGDNLYAVPTDVGKADQCAHLMETATAHFGQVDILVNNAGTNIKDRKFRELTPESWDKMIRANMDGAFYCTQAVFPQMLARKDGVIVNVVSISGKRANPLGGAAYIAAKFGKFTRIDDDKACLTVSARDSSGRYTGDQQAYLAKSSDSKRLS